MMDDEKEDGEQRNESEREREVVSACVSQTLILVVSGVVDVPGEGKATRGGGEVWE